MITIENQQKLFLSISKRLKKPITAYAVGGTAMMFMGFKDTTLDIDLVFETENDKNIFKDAIKQIGYQEIDSIKIYNIKRNQPEMLTLGDERFDLFVIKVIDFILSESIQQRAKQTTHQFNSKFTLKIVDPHDIILMKCATDRPKDIDDANKIINKITVNWDLLVEETKQQIKLGKDKAAFELGYFLEKLKSQMHVKIPSKVLDTLFNIVKKQIKDISKT